MSDLEPNGLLLAAKYIQGTLTEEEGPLLIEQLEKNPELLRHLEMNMAVDIWLNEYFEDAKTAYGFLEIQNTSFSEQDLSDLPNVLSPTDSISYWLKELALLSTQGAIPELNTPLFLPELVELPANGNYCSTGKNAARPVTFRSAVWGPVPAVIGVSLLLMIISLWCFQGYFGQKGDEFQPVAVVEETIDAKWEPGQPILKRGQATGPNRVALRSGLVKLRYAHGAEIVLEGPGEYVLTSETALWCDRGQISATIPPGAIGYEVSTPYARFIDRGTEFAIAVSESFSRLDVVRGKVDVSWAPELPRSGFTTGMAVQVDKASQIKQVSGEPGRYVDRVRFEKRLDDFVLRETQELNRREERLRGDPNLAARFVLSDPATGTIPNTGQQTDISDAVLHDVKKGQGPLRGMNATLIGKRASAIDVNLVGKRTLFSLAVRMRIDRLENTGNVICASDNFYTAAGSIFWQILRDGRIQLQIRGKDGRVVEFLSEPVYLRPSWGTWCDLILVVDTKGKQVQFVFDDQIVLNRSWEEAVPIEIGRATIGNVEKKTRMVRNRYLGGAIAELALFDEKIKTFQ